MKSSTLTYIIFIFFSCMLVRVGTLAQETLQVNAYISSFDNFEEANSLTLSDSLQIEKAAQLLFNKKVKKANHYFRKVQRTNTLFLKKLRQQESRLLAQLKTDSLKYQQYLSIKSISIDSLSQQIQDTNFIQKLSKSGGRLGLDTLQGLQKFMQPFGQSLTEEKLNISHLQEQVALQAYLQKQIANRTAVLERLLKGTNMESYSSRMKNIGLQYRQQTAYWKKMMDEPDAAEAKALDYLRGVEGFDELISNDKGNSSNNIAGKSVAELEQMGYQTKAKVSEQLQKQFGDQLGEIGKQAGEQLKQYTAALEKPISRIKQTRSQMQEAKGLLNEGKSILAQGAGIIKKQNGFKNPMRNIPFWHRWETQYNFQSQRASADGLRPAILQTGLNVSYRQSPALSLGLGVDASIGLGASWQHLRLSYEGIVGRVFLDFKIRWGFSLQGGYEKSLRPMDRAYTQLQEQYGNTSNVRTAMGLLQDAAYLGLMKTYKVGKNRSGTFLIGYNFLNDKTNISSPWIIRLGWKI